MPVASPQTAAESTTLGPVLDFMRRLWAIDHAMQSLSKRMESELGLTSPQRLVIRIVGRYPGISAGRLADILHVHPSTLTGVLGRLDERGLLTRKTDKADLRRALFTLTAKGRALDVPHPRTVEAAIEAALAPLPVRNIRVAEELLAQLATALAPRAAAASEAEEATAKPKAASRARAPSKAKAPKAKAAARPSKVAAKAKVVKAKPAPTAKAAATAKPATKRAAKASPKASAKASKRSGR